MRLRRSSQWRSSSTVSGARGLTLRLRAPLGLRTARAGFDLSRSHPHAR
jgi:hypothetical protein